jgi:hypothetical protein
MTAIESGYVSQGYSLPNGYAWPLVHELRAKWGYADHQVPVSVVPGICAAWGTPFINGKPLKH